MTNKKILFIFGLTLLACACFTTCGDNLNWENPIMKDWWEEEQEEEEYVSIIKRVKEVVYQTVIETKYIYEQLPPEILLAPPEVLLQHINIIDIQYILFAGDSKTYDEQTSPTPGGTNLTTEEMTSNHKVFSNMKIDFDSDPEVMLILHGHANPVTGTVQEAIELTEISTARAKSVLDALEDSYLTVPTDFDKRVTTKGYGGDRNLSTSGSTTSSTINRRVEIILFKLEF